VATTERIAAATRMGAVELTVSDLARSLEYWRESIGLEQTGEDGGQVSLGTGGEALVTLVEEPGAQPARHHTGLFHVALLLPERADLARWIAHAIRNRVPLTGASDHFVSEALYLSDPDEHGIEIYWDRPREVWEGQVYQRMTSFPLDVDSVMGELGGEEPGDFEGMPAGTTVGHVHLQVADVDETAAFYDGVLGMDVTARLGDQAVFLSAGGYHHHVGGNTWNSRGAGPPPPGSAALRHATIVLPDELERDRVLARVRGSEEREDGILVRDPSGVGLLLAIE
jgi:catechol 2,3-dioxygenase